MPFRLKMAAISATAVMVTLGVILVPVYILSRDLLTQVLKASPDHPPTHHMLGIVEGRQQRPQVALAHFQKAAAAPKAPARWHYDLGLCQQMLGDLPAAEAAYRKAVAANPKLADAWHNLGMVLRDSNRLEPAADALLKAAELQPTAVST